MDEAKRLAQAIYKTTPVDVANALAAGTLDREDVPDDLLAAMEDEGIEPDDDPDESAGWRMTDDGPEAE